MSNYFFWYQNLHVVSPLHRWQPIPFLCQKHLPSLQLACADQNHYELHSVGMDGTRTDLFTIAVAGIQLTNAVRSQKYVSHIQEMIKPPSLGIDRLQKSKGTRIQSLGKNDVDANNLIDEFEKLIQIHDSYGAFRRLAARKLGVPTIRVTIKEINEITKQVHKAYQLSPQRRRIDKV